MIAVPRKLNVPPTERLVDEAVVAKKLVVVASVAVALPVMFRSPTMVELAEPKIRSEVVAITP